MAVDPPEREASASKLLVSRTGAPAATLDAAIIEAASQIKGPTCTYGTPLIPVQ